MSERVTLKKIARLANVSIGTVDRALNGRSRINRETKKRVLEIAEALNYKPNSVARILGSQKKFRVGIVMASTPEKFCDHLRHGVKDALDEVYDFGVTGEFIISRTLSPADQLKAIKNVQADDFDAFLVNAGSRCIGEWMDAMTNAGKTVATFNSDVADSSRIFYVGDDPYRAGLLMGGYMGVSLCGEAPRVAMLIGFHGNHSHKQRCNGVIDAIVEAYPNAEFVWEDYQDESVIAQQKLESMLARDERLNAVFVASASGLLGAGTAISALPPDKRPMLFGYDVDDDVEYMMESGICHACIFQDPYWQGYYGMRILAEMGAFNQQPTRSTYKIRSKLITKYNVTDYIMDKRQSDEFLL